MFIGRDNGLILDRVAVCAVDGLAAVFNAACRLVNGEFIVPSVTVCGDSLGNGVAADGADLLLAACVRAGRFKGGFPLAVVVLAVYDVLVQGEGKLVSFLCQSCALLGCIDLCRSGVHIAYRSFHFGDLVIALLLHDREICVDHCLILIGAVGKQSVVAQRVNGPVVALFPTLGENLVAVAFPA